jgi:hypothetical protein
MYPLVMINAQYLSYGVDLLKCDWVPGEADLYIMVYFVSLI